MSLLDAFFGSGNKQATKSAPAPSVVEMFSGPGSLKTSTPRAPSPTTGIKKPASWPEGATVAPEFPEMARKAGLANAERARQEQLAKAKEKLRGTIPKEIFDSNNYDEIAEAVTADYNRRLQHYPKDSPDVPNIVEDPLRTMFGFLEGGASAVGDTIQGGLKLLGAEGKAVEPVTDRQVIERYREFLGALDPERLMQVRSNEAVIAKYPEKSLISGQVTESLIEGFSVGGAVVRATRMVPAVTKLRTAGRAGIYAANIIENIAVSVGINLEQGLTRGRDAEEIARSVAANPSVLLPLSSKAVVAIGGVADYFAARALGYSEQDAFVNAALNAGGNLAQRQGIKSELADFDFEAAKGKFLGAFKGNKQLGEAIWQESETLRGYAEANPQDVRGLIKMHTLAEKRLLTLKKNLEKGTIGENRTIGLKGRRSWEKGDPEWNPDELPIKPSSPEDLILEATKKTSGKAADAKASFEAFKKVQSSDIFAPGPKRTEVGKGTAETRKGIRSAIDLDDLPPPEQFKTELAPVTSKAPALKDLSGRESEFRDLHRNINDVFGKDSPEAQQILEPFDAAKGQFVDMQVKYIDDLKKNVVEKLGITKGSKKSAAVQTYGEALDKVKARSDLVKKFGETETAKIIEAEGWFRQKYDELIDGVNAVRKQIYPNNPEKLIPYRTDYFRHFREVSQDMRGIQALFETPAGIDPALAGISPYTKPKSKFASFAQRRLGWDSDVDAVGGFLDYIPSASFATHIDPQIARLRALESGLRDSMVASRSPNLNRFLEYLTDYTNDIAGKTSPYDRPVMKIIGRKGVNAVNWVNSRVKANTVVGNASSSLAQVFNVPQGIADTGVYSVPGAARTLADIFVENKPMRQSTFLKERFGMRGLYDQFDSGMLKNLKKFAVWFTGVGDEVGTRFIWNSEYMKAVTKKVKNPVQFADNATRRMVAGRGIGEVPLVYKSKMLTVVAPFQVEVGNLWNVMGDFKSEGGTAMASKLTTLFIASFLMNEAARKIRGSPVSFDPIKAAIDAAKNDDPDKPAGERLVKVFGRMGGEVLGNLPFGQTVANSLFTEDEGKAFFGDQSPTRYGSPILAAKIIRPIVKGAVSGDKEKVLEGLRTGGLSVIPPFGGAQIEKSIKGYQLLKNKGQKSQSGKTIIYKSPKEDDLLGKIQAMLFGSSSTKEAQKYFEGGAKGYDHKIGSGKPAKPKKPSKPKKK